MIGEEELESLPREGAGTPLAPEDEEFFRVPE
jgi:hypothetical protein